MAAPTHGDSNGLARNLLKALQSSVERAEVASQPDSEPTDALGETGRRASLPHARWCPSQDDFCSTRSRKSFTVRMYSSRSSWKGVCELFSKITSSEPAILL